MGLSSDYHVIVIFFEEQDPLPDNALSGLSGALNLSCGAHTSATRYSLSGEVIQYVARLHWVLCPQPGSGDQPAPTGGGGDHSHSLLLPQGLR